MQPLLIRPHYAYVSRWPDTLRQLDTPEALRAVPPRGPWFSAYLERSTPREILRGVHVVDYDHGMLYEVIAERRDGAPVLLRKTVAPYGADTLTDAAQLADGFLAALAVDYWENEAPENPLGEKERHVEPAARPRAARPSLERIAAFVRDTQAEHDRERSKGASRETLRALVPRHALSLRFHVHVQTADIWLRQARDAGLLPPARGSQERKSRPYEGNER